MPTNAPIPTLSTGNVLTAGEWNDLTPLNTTVGLFGAGGAISGSPAATTAPNFYIQAGYTLLSLSGGTGTVFFPNTFPNGLLSFTATVNEASGATQVAINGSGGAGTSGVSVQLYGPSGSGASGSHYVSWVAIGW